MKIAAASYDPKWQGDWEAMAQRLRRWVMDAAGQGADLLVFPEYAGIEAALIGAPEGNPSPRVWAGQMADVSERYADLVGLLAQKAGCYILAGSLCARAPQGLVNRAVLAAPTGARAWQDKRIPTPYERDAMGVVGGDALRVFDTELGRIAVLICYDAEFPLLARQVVEAGADIILVPSCTEGAAGQTRVRISARARAIEAQCLVVQAPLVGRVPGCDVVDVSTGRAGAFVPADDGLPGDGVLAQGATDMPGWTIFDADPDLIRQTRTAGQVRNFADWPGQNATLGPVNLIDLR